MDTQLEKLFDHDIYHFKIHLLIHTKQNGIYIYFIYLLKLLYFQLDFFKVSNIPLINA